MIGPLTFRGALGLNVDSPVLRTLGAVFSGLAGVTGSGAAYGDVDFDGERVGILLVVLFGADVFVWAVDAGLEVRLLEALLEEEDVDDLGG